MHELDESTNIAANLHCLCWSYIWPPGSTISLCILGFFFGFRNDASPGCAAIATNFRPTILANVGCTTFFHITVLEILRCQRSIVCDFACLWNSWVQTDFKVRLYFFYWINRCTADCTVISVFYGIEISHKLFTPEMVGHSTSVRGTAFGLSVGHWPIR